MLLRLTNLSDVTNAHFSISELILRYAEWFCTFHKGEVQAIRREEIVLEVLQERLVLTCWSERGVRSWRILAWSWDGQALLLRASRRMGSELPLIEMIPRASAASIAATIRAARQIRCDKMAQLALTFEPKTEVERQSLSPGVRRGQPGKYARIVLRRRRERIAVTALVVPAGPSAVDAFLVSALLWFRRTANRLRPPYLEQLWLIVSQDVLAVVLNRVLLLRENLQDMIKIFEADDDLSSWKVIAHPERSELWKKKLARFPPVPPATMTMGVRQLVTLSPDAIDVVHARHGETLRYFGLPFARVRSLLGVERVWFGVEASRRQILDDSTRTQFDDLLADLQQHRSASATDRRHAFYHQAAEAWLESLLRHDITKLDPGLIIAPLHAQFRTARGGTLGVRPVDMLALRRDGRLVVIELKVSEDREHVMQGADYWRRVEAHRRRGHIAKAQLFGDRMIRDEAPLVYLVAPTLGVHPLFNTIAQFIAHDIKLYRFDINDDWRSGVRVMRRYRAN